jgi:hypothetical protein
MTRNSVSTSDNGTQCELSGYVDMRSIDKALSAVDSLFASDLKGMFRINLNMSDADRT